MSTYNSKLLHHGGKLKEAALKYNIPLSQWLDLSTGINPKGWPVPQLPPKIWSRLPEDEDDLHSAASAYYETDNFLAVAGSQSAIQNLPLLKRKSIVGVITPTYNEHAHAWKKVGHNIVEISIEKNSLAIDKIIDTLDVMILINPNNPTGVKFHREKLLEWHSRIRKNNGWLIIDEEFIDTTPNESLISHSHKHGLIILRSLGKFFGLAGARVGFVFAEEKILSGLQYLQGPWTIASPSRWVAEKALLDTHWQTENRYYLIQKSTQLETVLTQHKLSVSGSCSLFHWIKNNNAQGLQSALAKHGVLTRLFTAPNSLRFGLPKSNAELSRLSRALSHASQEIKA